MQVRLLWMLLIGGVLLGSAVARAQDGGQAAATSEWTQIVPRNKPSLLQTDADEEALAFSKELRTVEEDVGDLKERVFRSKATLQLLQELLIDSAAGGAQVVLWHVNQLGGAYSIESVQYFLDGKNIYFRDEAEDARDEGREVMILERTLPPGRHNLQVQMVLRGKGYRVFSYLQSYQFRVQSSYAFDLIEGARSIVRVISESKGALRSFVERPTVRYDVRSESTKED